MKKRKQGASVHHSRTQPHGRIKSRTPAAKHAQGKQRSVQASKTARGANHPKRSRSQARTAPAGVFVLSADCTVAESAALKSGLLEVLHEPMPVTLDIASIQRIDTAGIQLITAFVRERESLGLQIEWRGAAPVFSSAARLLGVASTLRLPEQPS